MTIKDEQAASGTLIAARRREPSQCLYCSRPATTREHPLTEGVGGRLWARILRPDHNAYANQVADEHFNETFAPYVTMLQVARQRGGVGAEFVAADDAGDPIVIVREGFAKQQRFKVLRTDDKGRILHAVGDLDYIDKIPKQRMSPEGTNTVLVFVQNPEANFVIASDGSIDGAILKIALHFYAGFVADVPADTALRLLPYLSGEKVAAGEYVRTPFLGDDIFPDSWPARHEITCYPDDDHTIVTILLFSAYAYSCRLPLPLNAEKGLRYTQALDENFPRMRDDIDIPGKLDWNDHPGKYDGDAYFGPIRERVKRLHAHGAEQSVRARCQRAAKRAKLESSNLGNLWERYAAALGIECFSNVDVEVLVTIGKRLRDEGKPIWEVPVKIDVPSEV